MSMIMMLLVERLNWLIRVYKDVTVVSTFIMKCGICLSGNVECIQINQVFNGGNYNLTRYCQISVKSSMEILEWSRGFDLFICRMLLLKFPVNDVRTVK